MWKDRLWIKQLSPSEQVTGEGIHKREYDRTPWKCMLYYASTILAYYDIRACLVRDPYRELKSYVRKRVGGMGSLSIKEFTGHVRFFFIHDSLKVLQYLVSPGPWNSYNWSPYTRPRRAAAHHRGDPAQHEHHRAITKQTFNQHTLFSKGKATFRS
jgi:hypothetical protein